MSFRFDIIYEYREMFLIGALTTLGLTFVATLGGTLLGLLGALARIVRFEKGGPLLKALAWLLRNVSLLYVTLFRGTPLFVQIFIWYYVWSVALIQGSKINFSDVENSLANAEKLIAKTVTE